MCPFRMALEVRLGQATVCNDDDGGSGRIESEAAIFLWKMTDKWPLFEGICAPLSLPLVLVSVVLESSAERYKVGKFQNGSFRPFAGKCIPTIKL